MAETLFDLLDAEPSPVDDEVRIGPDDWEPHLAASPVARMVVGGPGTGKTRFLAETVVRAVDDGVDPSRILVLAFSRRGVEDLRGRLVARLGDAAHRVVVATIHSLAVRLVEGHAAELGWNRPPTIMTGVEQEALVGDLLASEDPDRWPAPFRPLLGSEALASEVTDFLLRAAEQRLGPDDIAASGRADWRAVPAFMERYADHLRSRHRVDYGLAVIEALRLADEAPELLHRFDHVVADEYQDTAPAQAALLMACVGPECGLVVAADPYQSVYSFRGADIANVYTFPDDVSRALGRSCRRIVLDTSLRVPEAILEAAVALTARELPGGAGKVHARVEGGIVACHEFATVGDEAEWIASDIERLHLLDGVPLERVAVFVRSDGPFVADLTRALDRRDLDHTHTDERLIDEPVVRFVHDLVRATGDDDEAATASMRRVLAGPFVGAPYGLVSSLPEDPQDWSDWIRRDLPDHVAIADLLDDDAWATTAEAPEGLWRVWSSVPALAEVAVDPAAARHRRAWAAHAHAVERARDRGVRRTLAEQVELSHVVQFEEDVLLSVAEGGVTVATLHRAKGTEFDVVYIADALEGALPDLRHRDSLLGVRHLHPHLPTETADYVAFRLDEERRLAYTAMTRASKRVVWTATVPSEHGSGSVPSRFMRLVAPSTPAPTRTEALTPRALVASVRRTVADPRAAPATRIAGVAWLAAGADGHHRPLESYGVRRRGDDHGCLPEELRLSPSHAADYDRCPRRYAISRFLVSRDDDSPFVRIGTAVHRALERAESAAAAAGTPRSTLEDALAELDEAWPDTGFGDDAVGAAWHARACRILETLYDGWPTAGAPLALEVPLRLDVDGVPWTGRADRIESSPDGMAVVDYKTGATPATKNDAAASLQLGFYAIAANASDLADLHGPVTGASFWYPGATPNRSGIATRHLDMARLDDVAERLAEITAAVMSEEFPPTPNRGCGRCPVRTVCPAMRVGREAFQR